MRPGRSMDIEISKQVMGYRPFQQKRDWYETTEKGTRPLRPYSTDMSSAWEVVEKLAITLVPVEHKSWFAFVGPKGEWKSPADLIDCLLKAEFAKAGAGVSESAAHAVCVAALSALAKRSQSEATPGLVTDIDSAEAEASDEAAAGEAAPVESSNVVRVLN